MQDSPSTLCAHTWFQQLDVPHQWLVNTCTARQRYRGRPCSNFHLRCYWTLISAPHAQPLLRDRSRSHLHHAPELAPANMSVELIQRASPERQFALHHVIQSHTCCPDVHLHARTHKSVSAQECQCDTREPRAFVCVSCVCVPWASTVHCQGNLHRIRAMARLCPPRHLPSSLLHCARARALDRLLPRILCVSARVKWKQHQQPTLWWRRRSADH
jgi:hypothetical protein